MKKFTFLIVAMLLATTSFAQATLKNFTDFPLRPTATTESDTRAVVGTLANCGNRASGIQSFVPGLIGIASRFEASQLTEYVGDYITEIGLYVQVPSVVASARVAVLGGTLDAPVILTEQSFTPVSGENVVTLQIPYQIQAGTPIMIAYEWNLTDATIFPTDAGPAVTGGDLMSLNGIDGSYMSVSASLGDAFSYNFYIYATVENEVSENPAIVLTTSELSFTGKVGEDPTEAQVVNVNAAYLTENISISTELPFEVSNDNTTFSTTTTIGTTGGPLYVRYNPAAEQTLNETGSVTLASSGATSQTINLTASTYDCSIAETELPYTESFDNGIPACWSVVDANNDGATWQYNDEGAAKYPYHSTNAANDYLITSKIHLDPGSYKVSFKYIVGSSSYPENLKVYLGTEPTAEAMTQEIVGLDNITNADIWRTETALFSITEAGSYYIGFKACSNADMFMIQLDDVTIASSGTGISENHLDNVSMYPNPCRNTVTIANAEGHNITIFNAFGQQVANIANATVNQTVNVSDFANGVYFVKVADKVLKLNVVK